MAAEAALSFAVETLGKLLIEKAVFLIGVKGEVGWLREELKSMQSFLKDAAKKQSDREMIRNWISDVRKVAHDAEDAIDIFVLKVQSKKLNKRYGCFPNHLYHLNKVGEQIASIRQKLKDIQERRVRYDIQKDERDEEGSTSRTRAEEGIETRRRLAYWKPDQHVVGLEEDVKQILGKAVFEKSQGLSVAAILGMGGMGKSTLASKIYNHTEVAGGFEFREWVVVSSEFNPEDIMKQILQKLGISSDDLKRLGSIEDKVGRQEQLKKEVHQRLSGKRYFIVLDDVWEAAHWESLSRAFPDGDKGSRLLITSRNSVITMNSGYVHPMKLLSDAKSWDLFMRKALGCIDNCSSDKCPMELKEVGEKIVKKCGGLPLAISVVGGLLAKKTPSKSAWEIVHNEMKSHLDIYTSSSSGDLNNIGAILELSYHNLPLELKTCFLCLGFFKEDVVIMVKELVHIWVAQGLVTQEVEGEQVRMEDVARDYLNELIARNMVQVKEMKYDEVKACQMHDLLRDLSIRKAREEIDFEVLREGQNSSHQSLAKPRHHALYFNEETSFIYSTNRNQHLHSLFFHNYYYDERWQDIGGVPSSYWKSFDLLRVLHFGEGIKFQVLPKGIGELTGLRYLRMRYRGKVSRLPCSWAKLKNLEVLHLWGFIKLDKVILKMESLRHLYTYVISSEVGLGNMRNLQTLQWFRVESCHDVWKTLRMSGVSKLGIVMADNIRETSSLFTCLASLENLFHLTLILFKPSIDVEGLVSLHCLTRLKLRDLQKQGLRHAFAVNAKLPAYIPPNLSHLTLSEIRLEEDPMPILEKLANLIYLKLSKILLKGIMVITSGGFPTLKVLHIKRMRYACKMEINEESAMPELNQFIITYCPDLDVENVPDRIKSAIVQPQ